MISILFVCWGNICRSPALQAAMQKLIDENKLNHAFYVESCGLSDDFIGLEADQRMKRAALAQGVVIKGRAQIFENAFYKKFDLILVVQKDILELLKKHAPDDACRSKIHLATEFSEKHKGQEIPDPFYGPEGLFDDVMDTVNDVCRGLLEHLKKNK